MLLLISTKVYAQQYFNWGLKEGMNTSQVSGDSYYGFNKFGFVGGAYFKVRLKGDWTIGAEVIFTQKGSRHNSNYAKGDFKSYFLELNYVEVPVLFQYHIQGFSFEFGPGCSFLAQTREYITVNGADADGTIPFNKEEINFNIGANYTFSSHFGFNFRFTNSVVPIRQSQSVTGNGFIHGQRNTVLALCLTYEFGDDDSM